MDTTPNQPAAASLPGRRGFLSWLTYGFGAVAALAAGIPFIGYLLGAKKAPEKWVNLGPLTDFPQGQTRLAVFDNPIHQPWDGKVARIGVYVRNLGATAKPADSKAEQHEFQVFAVNCAHLGCPVEWFPESGLFMCPCHGGVYYSNGERASGPPPQGLYHCDYRVASESGVARLEIQAPHFPTLQDPLRQPGQTT
jgi:Rieske Fe-S protein